jgi:hypothetical protein
MELAGTHDVDEIFVLLDLDDGCAVRFEREFRQRAEPIAIRCGKILRICFCVREFEAWFLANISDIRTALPEYNIDAAADFARAHDIRGAKEQLSRVCKTKGYKPTRDQNLFSKKINIQNLARVDRSFRKFLKEAVGESYEGLRIGCADEAKS